MGLPNPIQVVLVEAAACHLCKDAADALAVFADAHRIEVRRVDLASDEGRAIARRTRAPMPPIVLVDGELLGWGRLSRGKLGARIDLLERRVAAS